MEVIHISPSYKPAYEYGGPTMSVSQLCEQMQKCGLKLQVLTTTANGAAELAVSTGIRYMVAGVPVKYFSRITGDHSHLSPGLCFHLLQVVWRARKHKAHFIIHIHSWWNLVAILSCLVARVFKLTVVVSPRGMLTTYSFEHKKSMLKRCLHIFLGSWLLKGSHLHATSEKEKSDILAYVKPKTINVLPNLIDLPAVTTRPAMPVIKALPAILAVKDTQPISPISTIQAMPANAENFKPSTPFKLLFFSRIDKKKGVELLLRAVASLKVDYTLTIAGTGPAAYIEELQELTTALGIRKHIHWTGHVSNRDKYEMFNKHDLLVLASYNENFANVVIESLAVGTAVLVSEKVGLADYIIATQLGWVSSLEAADLAMQIEAISNQKEILTQIRLDGPTRIEDDFHRQVLAAKYMDFYKQLLVS